MLLKNLDVSRGLANGTRGKVIEFVETGDRSSIFPGQLLPKVEFYCTVGDKQTTVVEVLAEEEWSIQVGERYVRVYLPWCFCPFHLLTNMLRVCMLALRQRKGFPQADTSYVSLGDLNPQGKNNPCIVLGWRYTSLNFTLCISTVPCYL